MSRGLLVRVLLLLAIAGTTGLAPNADAKPKAKPHTRTSEKPSSKPSPPKPHAAKYRNPVIDADFPDPSVLKAKDGYYYAYATQTQRPDGHWINLQVARSHDLVHWYAMGDALPNKPNWARTTQSFWGPDVVEDHGRYILYFSAEPDAHTGMAIGVATASKPYGPFRPTETPLITGAGFTDIDPMAFDDPASGKHLLYWGSGFDPLRVIQLSGDRLHLAPDSKTQEVMWPQRERYEHLIEGAYVMKRGRWYYLFYSGDHCCGEHADYAVLVARSETPTGPFIPYGYANNRQTDAILQGNARWRAPGHNAIVRDAAGQDWILYHAIDARHPRLRIDGDHHPTRRVLMLSPIVYRGGWPEVPGGTPKASPTTGPMVR